MFPYSFFTNEWKFGSSSKEKVSRLVDKDENERTSHGDKPQLIDLIVNLEFTQNFIVMEWEIQYYTW